MTRRLKKRLKRVNQAKKSESSILPLPSVKLVEAKKEKTGTHSPSGYKEKSGGKQTTKELPGGLSNFEMWFKQQEPGSTAFYPGDQQVLPGNFAIEYPNNDVPSLPPSQHGTQNFIFTKNGEKVDMNLIPPDIQQKLWNDVKSEYVRTASPSDAVKMFLQENPSGNWTDFMSWKKESYKARQKNENLARNKMGESNIFYGTREYDGEGRIVKDERKKK